MDPAVFYDYVARRGRYLQDQQDRREKAEGDLRRVTSSKPLKSEDSKSTDLWQTKS